MSNKPRKGKTALEFLQIKSNEQGLAREVVRITQQTAQQVTWEQAVEVYSFGATLSMAAGVRPHGDALGSKAPSSRKQEIEQ